MMQPIPGFPGYYATRSGDVMSDRTGTPRRLATPLHRGYLHTFVRFGLGRHTVRKLPVHQLVLSAFAGPKPFDGAVTRHLNGDPTDNRPENLKWGTVAENVSDAFRHGTAAGLRRGDRHGRTRISDAAVISIRRSSAASDALAKEHGCTAVWIDRIRNGRARQAA